jgi:hypothetical protein
MHTRTDSQSEEEHFLTKDDSFYGATAFEDVSKSITFREANMTLIIDSYDTIFNQYDEREYETRAFSSDFVSECERRMHPSANLKASDIRIAVPRDKYNPILEQLIQKRMLTEYNAQLAEYKFESIKMQALGIFFAMVGVLMIGSYGYLEETFSTIVGPWFGIVLECLDPIAWYAIWVGIDIVLFQRPDRLEQWQRHLQLSNANIIFKLYNDQ